MTSKKRERDRHSLLDGLIVSLNTGRVSKDAAKQLVLNNGWQDQVAMSNGNGTILGEPSEWNKTVAMGCRNHSNVVGDFGCYAQRTIVVYDWLFIEYNIWRKVWLNVLRLQMEKEQMSGPGTFSEGMGKFTLCKLSPRL